MQRALVGGREPSYAQGNGHGCCQLSFVRAFRRFAKRRYLGEAEALRLIVAEFLDEDESQRELLKAERWQFKQAYATWQRSLRGEERTVPYEEIQKIFSDALAGRSTESTK